MSAAERASEASGAVRANERVNEQATERNRARERSEQYIASKQMSGASEQANGRASGPVL